METITIEHKLDTWSARNNGTYQHVNSQDLVNKLALHGYFLHDVQVPVSKRSKSTVHRMFFTVPGITGDAQGMPRLMVTNSYNGESSLRFEVGIYRVICGNGLMTSESSENVIRYIHRGTAFIFEDDFLPLTGQIAAIATRLMEIKQKALNIIDFDVNEFRRDLHLVKGTDVFYDIIRRSEDKAQDLWTVFNRTQETLIKGFKRRGARTLRATNGFDSVKELNQNLWARLEEEIQKAA